MKQSIGFGQFCDAFRNMGRNEQFTYAGKRALFDYLEEYEESTDTEVELDVIALCCDYSEYASALDCIKDAGYNFTPEAGDTPEEQEESALEWLNEQTSVIKFEGGIIIQQF